MKTLNKTLVVEAAIAGLFAAAFAMPVMADDAAKKADDKPMPTKKAPAKKGAKDVHCFGVNTCKGTSECAVDGKTSCKGQNACKGQGWISLSAKKCKAQKGTVPADKPAVPAAPAMPAGK